MQLIQRIDKFLNGITMYRLIVYGLLAILLVAFGLSLGNLLPIDPLALVLTVVVLVGTGVASNALFAKLFGISANAESSLITSLILVCVLNPERAVQGLVGLAAVGVLAQAAKYLFVIKRKHPINPVVMALVLGSFLGLGWETWWVGSANLLPIVLVVGMLVTRKIRREAMVLTFIGVATVMIVGLGVFLDGRTAGEMFLEAMLSWPLIFLGTIMLTEPLSTPANKDDRLVYALLVAVLMTSGWEILGFATGPATALFLGNIYSYTASSKQRVILKLKAVTKMSPSTWDFSFTPSEKVHFIAGQYAEWTLDLGNNARDLRGNRRYFTIASAPHEAEIRLGVKFYEPTSSYKKALQTLSIGDTVTLGQITGDFTLPKNPQPLLFLAGGVGITPFRSMLLTCLQQKNGTDITLIYAAQSFSEVVYQDVLKLAKDAGVRVILQLGNLEGVEKGWEVGEGFLNQAILKAHVGDIATRRVYISGPNVFVDAARLHCQQLGVKKSAIVTDYFPGY